MNRRDMLKITGAAVIAPAALPASDTKAVRLWEFYGGSGDDEVIAAYTKREAISFMQSLVGPYRPCGIERIDSHFARKHVEDFLPENVHEISGANLMHDSELGTDDDPHGPLVPMSSVLKKNIANGCAVPHVLSSMNF